MNKRWILVTGLVPVILSLTGCGGMFSNEARCPFKDQGGCQSVSDVNRMVSEGQFTRDGHFVKQADSLNTPTADWPDASRTAGVGWGSRTPYAGQPLRTQEVDARAWVAPWEDQDHVYHGASYFTYVVKPAQWANAPVKAIQANSYQD